MSSEPVRRKTGGESAGGGLGSSQVSVPAIPIAGVPLIDGGSAAGPSGIDAP